jgi:hypothetical protein
MCQTIASDTAEAGGTELHHDRGQSMLSSELSSSSSSSMLYSPLRKCLGLYLLPFSVLLRQPIHYRGALVGHPGVLASKERDWYDTMPV